MQHLKSSRGEAVMVVVGLVALLALAGVGYYAYQSRATNQAATAQSTDSADTDNADLSSDLDQAASVSADDAVPSAD